MIEIPEQVASKALAIQTQLNQDIETARNDSDLTREGRARRLAIACVQALDEMTELHASWEGASRDRAEITTRDVFGAEQVTGADAISFRDAADRASRTEAPDQAMVLLDQAQNTGDDVLARAVAQHAFRHRTILGQPDPRWREVVDAYALTRPDVLAKLEELEAERLAGLEDSIRVNWMFFVPKPSELEHDSEYRIRAIAGTPGPAAPRETQLDRNRAVGRTIRRSQDGHEWRDRHVGL